MLRELQVFPSRRQKLPSLIYSKEELEQQLQEQSRLHRYLKKTRPFQLESIPHDVFDVLKTDLTQPTLQKKTGESLTLFPVTHFASHKENAQKGINEAMVLNIEEYRVKRRRLLEPPPKQITAPPQEQPQTITNTTVVQVETNENSVQQQVPSPIAEQPQETPAVISQTTSTSTSHNITPIDITSDDLDTWYRPTDALSSITYTFPSYWVPLFPTPSQIEHCQAESNVNSELPSQYLLAFDKTLEYLNYPLNGEVNIEEETLSEYWASSEKLKLLKGLTDTLTDQDICIAVLAVDMDGEGLLLDLLETSGYECSRICNVPGGEDNETEYGVVFHTNKNKVATEFDSSVDIAFVMDPRILRNNTEKRITTLRARHDPATFAPLCYFVTMSSVEERTLRWILRDGETTPMTDEDLKKTMLATSDWPLNHEGANKFVLANLLSWLESKSKLDYTYRSKRKLPGSIRVEPVIMDKPTAATTTITPEEEESTSTPVVADNTNTEAADLENNDVSDMDVSSDEEESRTKTPSDYITTHIEKIFPEFTVNKTQLTNGEQAQTSITELDKKVINDLDQGLLQDYLKSASEAKERFEKEIKELKEQYKKLALSKTIELYN